MAGLKATRLGCVSTGTGGGTGDGTGVIGGCFAGGGGLFGGDSGAGAMMRPVLSLPVGSWWNAEKNWPDRLLNQKSW